MRKSHDCSVCSSISNRIESSLELESILFHSRFIVILDDCLWVGERVCVHKILPSGHTILPTFSFMIVLNPDDFFFLTHTQHTLIRPLFIQFTANSPHHTDFSSMLHSISLSEFSQISTNSILGGKNCISVWIATAKLSWNYKFVWHSFATRLLCMGNSGVCVCVKVFAFAEIANYY